MNKATNIFFVGKGGVGKSTSSALTSVFLAQKGFQVLIISLDPAHNQSDIFEKNLSDKPFQIAPNLLAIEIDQEFWIKQYLKDIHNQINKTYSYLTALNLDKYFKVIKHSPGLEEYALILAFEQIRKDFSQLDYLIFDMPPTALALKFFNLPSLSMIWIEHLLALREVAIKNALQLVSFVTPSNDVSDFPWLKIELGKDSPAQVGFGVAQQGIVSINYSQDWLFTVFVDHLRVLVRQCFLDYRQILPWPGN